MPKTLILLFHPHLERSRANKALCEAAHGLPDVEIVDMQALYPDGRIDTDAEVHRLIAADRIVFQFPLQWYSTPPLLKSWQDAVLTRMFYIAYEAEGAKLAGKPLLVVATAGNAPDAYAPDGANLFPLHDLLKPLRATAHRCGLAWAEPFLIYNAHKADDEALQAAAEHYVVRLGRLAATESGDKAA
ncbi:Putative NADPH-quinone reductase (modulator of drug activity B) [Bosea sp. OK403]|uniref:NAD(P)H-dependent oxidoreductase n=1 Tax=Bosea sp. OK403 TaxID=1855286 RepID=UPI0008E9D166|nr:NAD(P)H-dependent oxidoreductase [Bosea sp. OK403]SFI65103.1 Putative NADPH-quinone reductase (modulator of drug activity B) [Bosea sp. OK403]